MSARLATDNRFEQPDRGGHDCAVGIDSLASAAAVTVAAAVTRATSPADLDALAALVWRGYAEGALADADATFLDTLIRSRRTRKSPASDHCRRFPRRRRVRSPDRQASVERRRRLGGSSSMPDTLRHHYTEGERAVLCIVAGEVKHHGLCDLPIDKIGALAGVHRTTVQNALRRAVQLGHVSKEARPIPGRKNLSNLVRITSREWRVWINRGPSAHRPLGFKSAKSLNPTKSIDSRQQAFSRDQESKRGLSSGKSPPGLGMSHPSLHEE